MLDAPVWCRLGLIALTGSQTRSRRSVGFGKDLIEFRLADRASIRTVIVPLQGAAPLVRLIGRGLVRQHPVEEEGPARCQLDRERGARVDAVGDDLAIAVVVVAERPRLVSTRNHMHAPVLHRGWIERDPDPDDRIQWQHGEVGIVLMPRLDRADMGWLEQRLHSEGS